MLISKAIELCISLSRTQYVYKKPLLLVLLKLVDKEIRLRTRYCRNYGIFIQIDVDSILAKGQFLLQMIAR